MSLLLPKLIHHTYEVWFIHEINGWMEELNPQPQETKFSKIMKNPQIMGFTWFWVDSGFPLAISTKPLQLSENMPCSTQIAVLQNQCLFF